MPGHDVQLRILQALPSLLQNYPVEVRGDLLSIALQICSALQTAKNPAVSNTAAATLQQLVISVFDRVVSEDGKISLDYDHSYTKTVCQRKLCKYPPMQRLLAMEVPSRSGRLPMMHTKYVKYSCAMILLLTAYRSSTT
jgi:hypothetical protein